MRQAEYSFRHDSLQDANSIRNLLGSLTKGLGEGRLTFSDEDGEIVMEPEGLLQLKLTASKEDGHHRISLRISWRTQAEAPKKGKTLAVRAGSGK